MVQKFLLVDDHAIIRTGLSLILSSLFPDCLVDEAFDGDMALDYVKSNDYDLVVLDLNMPNTDSSLLVSALLSRKPDMKILIFTTSAESIFAKHYLKLGISGFISKEVSKEELKKAIVQILQNKWYLSEDMLYELSRAQLSNQKFNPLEILSKRELQLLVYLIKGENLAYIAQSLNIGKSTVATHKANIFEKLQVHDIDELREMARLHGIA